MSPLRTQKKRSPGRPKENKLIRELKVKTWFAAVAKASGKTAYELEKEFAPSYVDRGEFGKHRARLWDKYRLGKTMPTIKSVEGGRRPIGLLVEDKYPGTLRWITSPLWDLVNLDIVITMRDIRSVYESIDPTVRAELIDEDSSASTIFWRKPNENLNEILKKTAVLDSHDELLVLVCLLREALICQKKNDYEVICDYLMQAPKTKRSNATANLISTITKFIKSNVRNH